jgi:thiamine biosynthesis lipoprotein
VITLDATSHLHHRITTMGTVFTLDLYYDPNTNPDTLLPHIKQAEQILFQIDDTFSTYKPNSPLSLLRRGELSLEDSPSKLRDVLQACHTAKTVSAGWFDPWSIPGGVDPSGYVKGWAADQVLTYLRHAPVLAAIVNGAGDIATFTAPSIAEPFHIGITNPRTPSRLLGSVYTAEAVASSGSYERGVHLYDPYNNLFAARALASTVLGPDLGLADALATALCVGGSEVLARIDNLALYEAMLVHPDGTVEQTSGFNLLSVV